MTEFMSESDHVLVIEQLRKEKATLSFDQLLYWEGDRYYQLCAILNLERIEEAWEKSLENNMDECDCNYPECMECFERSAKAQIEYCGADKHLYYEWMDIKGAEYAEEHTLEDYNPEALEEIIKNPNEW